MADPVKRARRTKMRAEYQARPEVRERKRKQAAAKRLDPVYVERRRQYERDYYRANRERIQARKRPQQRARWKRVGGDKPRRFWPDLWICQCGLCGICREPMLDLCDVQVDHIHPADKGGTSDFGNLQAVHSQCNYHWGGRVVMDGIPKPSRHDPHFVGRLQATELEGEPHVERTRLP